MRRVAWREYPIGGNLPEWRGGYFLEWGQESDGGDDNVMYVVAIIVEEDGRVRTKCADGGMYFLDDPYFPGWLSKFEVFLNWVLGPIKGRRLA